MSLALETMQDGPGLMAQRDLPLPGSGLLPEVVLLIDLTDPPAGVRLDGALRVVSASSSAVDAALLAQVLPDLILTPLFAGHSDAAQVVARLTELGYGGRLTVVSPRLPNRRMVETELRGLATGIEITLTERE